MGKLDGKVAIITGTSRSIGKAIAFKFAAEGANLGMCARTEDKLFQTAKECRELGAKVVAVRADIGIYDQLKAFMDATVAEFGGVDILVNNAAESPWGPGIMDYDLEMWNKYWDVDFMAVWHTMRMCFPYMKERGGGAIVNFASVSGEDGHETLPCYACAKESVRALSRCATRDWGKYNIRVNCVSPLAVNEMFEAQLATMDEEARQNPSVALGFGELPLRRMAYPKDIANAVLFLASDDSYQITGQNLHVDAGALTRK